MSAEPEQIESLLKRLNEGDKEAESELIPLVYNELRTLASRQLRREPGSQSISTTALVHEAYVRLSGEKDVEWRNRAHFLGVAAQLMRRILVDHARARLSERRSGGPVKFPLDEALVFTPERSSDLLALDEALGQLKLKDERTSRVVELRFFGGLTVGETAAAIGVAQQTVRRDWNFGRAWLRAELTQEPSARVAATASGDRSTGHERPEETSGAFLMEVPVETAEFEVGYLVSGRFRIRSQIGVGAMGEVYEAEDIELGRPVALKMLRAELSADPGTIQRLKRECGFAAGISHPNVCAVFDVGQFRAGGRNRVFLSMQFLKGQTLAQRISSQGKFASKEVLDIARDMAAGLDAIHESGMVHRAFKPSNVILVPRESGEPAAVITDFGSPGMAGYEGRFVGKVMGTVTYVAPEQVTGERISPATDVYAFGCVLLEMLTGRPPYSAGGRRTAWTRTRQLLHDRGVITAMT